MLIGYARISTPDQKLDLQVDDLRRAGCGEVFTDMVSGARDERPGLRRALDMLDSGDVLVVWKLDRLGRSLPHLVTSVNDLQKRGVEFRSLQENIDTTTPGGRLVFYFFAALAEFERELIRERTKCGAASRQTATQAGRGRSEDVDGDGETKNPHRADLRLDGDFAGDVFSLFESNNLKRWLDASNNRSADQVLWRM